MVVIDGYFCDRVVEWVLTDNIELELEWESHDLEREEDFKNCKE